MSSIDAFFELSSALQHRIDSAFDDHRIHDSSNAGGFIGGGGFLVEDEPDSNESARIPLTAIPAALARVGLSPDDEQVLLVFKNAASGWQSSTNQAEEIDEHTPEDLRFVSREDWRSVCAVLFEGGDSDEHETGGAPDGAEYELSADEDEDDDGAEDDVYDDNDDPNDSDWGSDQDQRRRRTRRNAKRAVSESPSRPSSPKTLTSRQRAACLETYALFFPDSVPDSELLVKRLMIPDLQNGHKLVNVPYKAEELIAMLQEFSTSPDKSMGFEDFGQMMLATDMI